MTLPHNSISTRARRWLLASAATASLAAGFAGVPGVGAGTAVHAAPLHRYTSSNLVAVRAEAAVEALVAWQADRDPVDYVRYVQSRDTVADLLADELGLSAPELRDQFAQPATAKQHAYLAAISQLGVPYRSMKSEEGVGFDCSGLTSYAYAQAGIEVPRSSGSQIRAAERIDRADAEAGDLVQYPGHVGIYLGGDIYVHAPQPGRDVEVIMMPDRRLAFGDVTG